MKVAWWAFNGWVRLLLAQLPGVRLTIEFILPFSVHSHASFRPLVVAANQLAAVRLQDFKSQFTRRCGRFREKELVVTDHAT